MRNIEYYTKSDYQSIQIYVLRLESESITTITKHYFFGGGLCDYKCDYKITIDIDYEITMNIQVSSELSIVNIVFELFNVNILEF